MLIARDHEAVERCIGRPMLLNGEGHSGSGFTCPDYEGSTFRRLRQMLRNEPQRIGRCKRRIEALKQQITR
jgi:hypothetical protein